MQAHPTFSIITVTWRNLTGLRLSAASIDAQAEREFEWIVVDGGSDDGTADWLASQSPGRCRWISEHDHGIFDAMNKGLDRAVGDYVVFLNAGDEFASPSVLAAVRWAIDNAIVPPDLVYGDSIDVEANGVEHYRASRSHTWIPYGMFTSHQAMYFRRAHFPELRHSSRFPTTGDYAFVAQVLRGDPIHPPARCTYLAQPLCRFALGGTNFVVRRRALLEDYRIRREILGVPLMLAAILFLLHAAHYQMKIQLPALANALRYGSETRPGPRDGQPS